MYKNLTQEEEDEESEAINPIILYRYWECDILYNREEKFLEWTDEEYNWFSNRILLCDSSTLWLYVIEICIV